jgi:hypothetical protein
MKQLNQWVGVCVIIYSFNVIESSAEEHAPSLASRSILRSLLFSCAAVAVWGLRHKRGRVPVSGRKQIDSPQGSNYLTSTV